MSIDALLQRARRAVPARMWSEAVDLARTTGLGYQFDQNVVLKNIIFKI